MAKSRNETAEENKKAEEIVSVFAPEDRRYDINNFLEATKALTDAGHLDNSGRRKINEEFMLNEVRNGSFSSGVAERFHSKSQYQVSNSTLHISGYSSIRVEGNMVGSQIITGDNNTAQMRDVSVQLISGEDVDIVSELKGLRETLQQFQAPDNGKIDRALQDAEEEAAKGDPDKDEIGSAIERALKYAKSASDFGDNIDKIAGHLGPIVSWLGTNWVKILPLAGIALQV